MDGLGGLDAFWLSKRPSNNSLEGSNGAREHRVTSCDPASPPMKSIAEAFTEDSCVTLLTLAPRLRCISVISPGHFPCRGLASRMDTELARDIVCIQYEADGAVCAKYEQEGRKPIDVVTEWRASGKRMASCR